MSHEHRSRFRIIPMPIIVALLAVGLVSSLAFRAIIVAGHIAPDWVRPLWYTAVLLNAAFFSYRYWVSLRRVRAVVDGDLDGKLQRGEPLQGPERAQAAAILHPHLARALELPGDLRALRRGDRGRPLAERLSHRARGAHDVAGRANRC